MSPFVCYHATGRYNRESILQQGLLAQHPCGFVGEQPCGVYAFAPDLWNENSLPLEWTLDGYQDVWQIAYIGPMRPDPLVRNAVILPSVTDVTLVTGTV